MTSGLLHITSFCLALLCNLPINAQPSLASSQLILDQKIYSDVKLPALFYYIPADYKILTETNGKPSFTLTEMRYTGSSSAGDAGVSKFNNHLQFHVVADDFFQ